MLPPLLLDHQQRVFFFWQPNPFSVCEYLCAAWLWAVIRQGPKQLLPPQISHHSAGSPQGQHPGSDSQCLLYVWMSQCGETAASRGPISLTFVILIETAEQLHWNVSWDYFDLSKWITVSAITIISPRAPKWLGTALVSICLTFILVV